MSPTIQSRLRVTQIISAAFALSVVIYGILAVALLGSRDLSGMPAMPPGQLELLRGVLYLIALVVQAAPVVFGRVILGRPGGPDELGARLQTRAIVALAVAEMPAMFGLVLALVGHSLRDILVLGAISLALIALRAPTAQRWHQVARDLDLSLN